MDFKSSRTLDNRAEKLTLQYVGCAENFVAPRAQPFLEFQKYLTIIFFLRKQSWARHYVEQRVSLEKEYDFDHLWKHSLRKS